MPNVLAVDIPAISITSLPPDCPAADQRAFLARLTSIIGEYRYYVEQLEEMQRDAETYLATYPVLTLPNEITSRIFAHCLPNGPVRPAPHTAPLVLAQICQHWRAVALSTCELWSSIDLVAPYRDSASAVVKSWLARAKFHPLSLKLDARHLVFTRSISARLGRIVLTGTAEQLRDLRPFPSFPNLQHLDLQIRYSEPPSDELVADFLKNTSRLHKLKLHTFPIQSIPFVVSLTSLDIRREIGLHTFIHVLTHLLRLEDLRCTLEDPTTGATEPPITVPQLQSLTLLRRNHFYASTCSLALASLTLPGLTRLLIDEKPNTDIVLAFAARSSCRLKYFTADLSACTTEENVRWLQAFPFLTALEVTLGEKKDEFLTTLTTTSLVPSLRTITIDAAVDASEFNDDYTLVVQMLRQRQATGLRGFQLNLYDEDGDAVWDQKGWRPGHLQGNQLLRIVAAGCKVQIRLLGEGSDAVWPLD
ncbi:hypothetical protein C8R46DRAFT_996841 [Mycena filopes]|nr:hypothetical protein C8R46DRAFT_996841 [Mycena filopes]